MSDYLPTKEKSGWFDRLKTRDRKPESPGATKSSRDRTAVSMDHLSWSDFKDGWRRFNREDETTG